MNSQAVLDRLTSLHPKVIDLSLGRVERLLARLGNPERKLPTVVHVAGTNGKGSVIAFMRAMAEAAGRRVHAATSPHLVRFNERIRIAGEVIADDALVALLEECEDANGGAPITFFEITTAAALLAFSRAPADVVLLETGLGGRLDATNVLDKPALTVITSISLDHQKFLGDTLEEVAGEKAGILKPGVSCVVAKQTRKVTRLIAERAKEVGAPLIAEGKDWYMRTQGDGLIFEGAGKGPPLRLPLPRLVGGHQVRNAGLAVAALDALADLSVPDGAMAMGLRTVEWPARLQRLVHGPLVEALPEGWELWLDGGHNAGAAKTIAAHTRQWRDRPLHLILGMLNSKDPVAYLQALEGKLGLLRGVAIPGEENSLGAQAIADAARTLRLDAEPAADVASALENLTGAAPDPARVLICGSLYLAGTVLRENG